MIFPRSHLALCLIVVLSLSCAAMQKRYEKRDRLAAEIIQLDSEIRSGRHELGLSARPSPFLIQKHRNRHVRFFAPRQPRTQQCHDICDLARFVCEAKDEICRIAGELGEQDTWAQSKCDGAKASCVEANSRCKRCVQKEPTPDPSGASRRLLSSEILAWVAG